MVRRGPGLKFRETVIRRQRTIFLTGGTGFIGQYVLRELLERGEHVVVLLRKPKAKGLLRLAGLMRAFGIDLEQHVLDRRLVIAEGSLPHDLPDLGANPVTHVLHSAACLQVDHPNPGEPFTTNVEGAKSLAQWAQAHEVEHFHFVSTAYTCGRDMGRASEVFHLPRPRFGTDYELSKWLAEEYLLNWAASTGRRLTILRPSLVIGDSRTGFTTQYGGFYQLAHMIEVLERFFADQRRDGKLCLPMRIAAPPGGRQNLVPVDFVAGAIVEILGRTELSGQIYHLTNPCPPTNVEVKEWLERYYQVWGGHFVDEVDPSKSESPAESMFLNMNELVLQQFKFVPEFDCNNTTQALAGTRVTFPKLDQAMAFRLLDYARAQSWGRPAKAAAS